MAPYIVAVREKKKKKVKVHKEGYDNVSSYDEVTN